MNHLNEEELIAYFYKQSLQPEHVATHLRKCRECADIYAAISRSLTLIKVIA
ncbi:MAG TPA: hypothetical protein VIX90_12570 [Edaphobacter sp.]